MMYKFELFCGVAVVAVAAAAIMAVQKYFEYLNNEYLYNMNYENENYLLASVITE